MEMTELLDRLGGGRSVAGGFMARCPAHDDQQASLSLTEAEDRILAKCHAGCATEDVLGALGLDWRALFSDDLPASNGAYTPPVHMAEPEAEYVYTDERGIEHYRVQRFPGKRFKHVRRKFPYHLVRLIGRDYRKPVYIVEGEKDVHALEDVGCTATTGGGTGVWEAEWSKYFDGVDVVIVADKDGPGREHAKNVAELLYPVAKTIRIVEALAGKDAADHLKMLTPKSFVTVREVK